MLLSLVLAVLCGLLRGPWLAHLADGVLADAILIPPHPPIPPANIRMVRGPQKSTATSNRKTIY